MILNLNDLNIKDEISFSENVFKNDDLDKRIYDLINSKVSGRIYVSNINDVILECIFSGTMIIDDSVTLDKIPYEFEINIEENLKNIEENYQDCFDFSKNTLDLIKVLWQNIVLEVPISYTKVIDANLKGNGWELKTQEKSEDIDPRLKKLEDLLKGDD